MKFNFVFNKIALHIAVENENAKLVKLLLSQKEVDINNKFIFK